MQKSNSYDKKTSEFNGKVEILHAVCGTQIFLVKLDDIDQIAALEVYSLARNPEN